MLTKEEGRKNLPAVVEMFKRWKIEREELNNEEDVKALIEELFIKVLGWDKDDIYRERHPGPTSKRADFQFRDKGSVKLILETKPMSKSWDKTIIRQAIGYGWSSNKEYVVLTNFQRLILFNAKWKDEDKKIFEIENIEECLTSETKFDFLWLLSKESLSLGKLDEFSYSTGKKFKKAEISTIDKQLLNDLKKWRKTLTKDIKILNKLTEEEVDDVVQKIINRLIFIRVCEDRGLEPTFAELRSHLRIWSEKKVEPLLKHLLFVFHHYDSVYDGTIFKKDDLCEKIDIHNNILEKIIEQLYVAEDVGIEYNFASIDADVLGSVYEEYLGYLLKDKKITENHAHRKEQGIYYTPTYIVDYIVRNTLGELLKQSKEIDKIKVLDPACGSGSFLIKAFDVISEFYKEKIGEEKFDRQIKNSILTNNIYGVDLDPKAVEIAQLNLFLKIGEKGELPKLRENIRCGNSLIDDQSIAEDRAFKWKEKFKEIMDEGGFDVVIGNPPYGAEFSNIEKEFLKTRYSKDKTGNSASFFILKGLELVKENGYFAYIVPKQLTYISSWKYVRKKLLDTHLVKVIDVSEAFQDVELEQIVFIIKKQKPSDRVVVGFSNNAIIEESNSNRKYFSSERFPLWVNNQNYSIFNKVLSGSITLNKIAHVNWGGPVAKYLSKMKIEDSITCIRGREISRYSVSPEYFIKTKDIIPNYYIKGEKLLFQRIVSRCGVKIIANYRDARMVGTYCNDEFYADKTVTLIWDSKVSLKYLLGLLNSKLISWFAHRYIWNRSQLTMEFMYSYAKNFPIKIIPLEEQQPIINLVDKMLSLNKRHNEIGDKQTDERTKIEEEIKRTDKEIDEFVYKIYGITDEEKKVIEEV